MTNKHQVHQPAGNYYDKYHTRNPVARALMQNFLRNFAELVPESAGRAIEIGCGEGELSIRLAKKGWSVQACDVADEAVGEARRRFALAGLDIPVRVLDIRDAGDSFAPAPLVICCEVLEHLEDPNAALRTLIGLSTGHLVVSVPREPIWRMLNVARGRYIRDGGNTPGHVQHWSRNSFLAMLARHVDIVAVRTPLPWTMALCRVR